MTKEQLEEALVRAQQRLDELEERYRYLAEDEEAQRELAAAKEAVGELKRTLEEAQRREVEAAEARRREAAEKEKASRKARSEAQRRLPGLAAEVERRAEAYWGAVARLLDKFKPEVEGLAGLADALDAAREEFARVAEAAGELPNGRASRALNEFLQRFRERNSAAVPPLDKEAVELVAWLVGQARLIGERNLHDPLRPPLGGPSLRTSRARAEEVQRRFQEKMQANLRASEEARRKREDENCLKAERITRRIAELVPQYKQQLLRMGYSPVAAQKRAQELAHEKALNEEEELAAGGQGG